MAESTAASKAPNKNPGFKRKGRGWQATYRAADGRERSATFDTLNEAKVWRTGQLSARDRGDWVDPQAGKVTFGEAAASWAAAQVHRPTTVALVASHLNNHAVPVFGHRTLSSVRPSEVQAWVKGLADELAPATVEVVFRFFSAVFAAAVVDQILARNPCAGVKLPKRTRAQVVPLETAQVFAVIDAMPERLRCAAVLGAGCGLRQGEALGVTLDRVDFLRRQLVVDRQLLTLTGEAPRLGPPKTESSDRTIPLADFVLAELARHLERFEPGEGGLLFTSATGAPVPRNRFAEAWRAAATSAGLPATKTFHDLRHYFASLLIRHGESVKVVQARLGHSSATETLDTYSHLWPDSEDRTRRAVDEVLSALSADSAADFSRTSEALAE
jgi:integrase